MSQSLLQALEGKGRTVHGDLTGREVEVVKFPGDLGYGP